MTVALTVGLLMAGAVYLFSKRELLRVILGMVLLGHAANLAILATGGTDRRALPFVDGGPAPAGAADPLPQAFVLTAIVISFAVTGRADDAVAAPGERPDVREAAAADARFPLAERHAAARTLTGSLPAAPEAGATPEREERA